MNPIFITLTGPTCSGKSYLLQYIRDIAQYPCFVSTTTRPPRQGEKEGKDYHFISESESRAIELRDGFAELMTFSGYRYGVTKEEFSKKLAQGPAFLIVEPNGIDHYAKPALEVGATWLKYFIQTDLSTRIERFEERLLSDLYTAASLTPVVKNYTKRLVKAIKEEENWVNLHVWTRILGGVLSPAQNFEFILQDIAGVSG